MKSQDLKKKKLPDSPGVYFFVGNRGKILYIGRATSLRDRVKSYFWKDLINTRGTFLVDMIEKAKNIKFERTDSVLEAIILEANLIRKLKPEYNTASKDDKSFNYVVITDEEYPRVVVARGKDLQESDFKILSGKSPAKVKNIFGPFTAGLLLKEAITIVRKIFPFRDDKCKPNSGRPCFNRQIGLCPGVCTGEISKEEYKKTIRNIVTFFSGKKSKLERDLKRMMKDYAKAQEFEKANDVKRTIFALNHIQDISLLKEEKRNFLEGNELSVVNPVFRIEAYDVAHLSGKMTTGVMVVIENEEINKSNYRKFKVRLKGNNDVGGLMEIMTRRFNHDEWANPNLIVVDGGIAQKRAAEEILRERRLLVPVIAVTKDDKHKPHKFLGDESLIKKHKKSILLANSEAHRFAIQYHRSLRKIR